MSEYCPCQSNKIFNICCGPILSNQKPAKTPILLMRSRYTAYALGGYGDYLLGTWYEKTRGDLTALSLSVSELKWLGLKIIAKSQKGDVGFVEFEASYLGEQGETLIHHERSEFKRVDGQWFYVGIDEQ